MSPGESSLLDRLRQPEYTGENRCTPCTIVNVGIAVVVAGAASVALVVFTAAGIAPGAGLGLGLFALFSATIYLRGYLVPGTPTLTKRYFPDWLLAKFDKLPEDHPDAGPEILGGPADGSAGPPGEGDAGPGSGDATGGPTTDPEDVDVEQHLLDAGAVEPCEDVEDLCLTDEFDEAWTDAVDALDESTDRERIADILGVEGNSEIREFGDAFVLTVDDRRAGQWESEAALLSDLASAEVLADHYEAWEDLDSIERGQIVGGLRIFVTTCPSCGGPVSLSQDTVESCCRSYEVVAAHCERCEDRLLEVGM